MPLASLPDITAGSRLFDERMLLRNQTEELYTKYPIVFGEDLCYPNGLARCAFDCGMSYVREPGNATVPCTVYVTINRNAVADHVHPIGHGAPVPPLPFQIFRLLASSSALSHSRYYLRRGAVIPYPPKGLRNLRKLRHGGRGTM